ncbi:PQQ-dependent dehydrogenase, methanol/ethanol family [Sphaerotilaceae bacterium SBD11-9]
MSIQLRWHSLGTLLAVGLVAGIGSQSLAADVSSARLRAADKEPGNWLTVGGTYAETRFSPLDKINTSNVQGLKLAWYGDLDTNRGQEGTPLVADGVMYVSTAWSKVFAYDAATGKSLWQYDPQVRGRKAIDACCDVVNRGVAVLDGKVFIGTLDGRLVALDAKTGKSVWETLTIDPAKPMTITGAPRAFNGKVVIGNTGSEYGVRPYITAYDASTGKKAWRFYITPNPENKPDGEASDDILTRVAYASWGDGAWKQAGGGGSAWDAIVFDDKNNQIIFGTGNGVPWSKRARSGKAPSDDLFVASIVAVDADTGRYRWHYQATPSEEWDFDATQPIVLADLKVDGRPTQVAMQANKNGFFYVIERKTGKLVSGKTYTPINWASGIDPKSGRPIVYPEAQYSLNDTQFLAMPAAFGSHNWHPMSFSPKTGLVYIPAQEVPMAYGDDPGWKYTPGPGVWNLAIAPKIDLTPTSQTVRIMQKASTKGQLIAWDPLAQKEVWRFQYPSPGAGGVLSTAGNLVFQGTPNGALNAYRADTGQRVWSYPGQSGIIAGAMSYMVGSEQYVAVLAGFGGASSMHVPWIDDFKVGPHGRVLVFKLGGKASLPDYEEVVQPANVPSDKWSAETVAKGAALYGNCMLCHGFGVVSSGPVPDLRRSPFTSSRAAFEAVVIEGVKEAKGMPSFKGALASDDLDAIRAYIADRARQLQLDEKTMTSAGRKPTRGF